MRIDRNNGTAIEIHLEGFKSAAQNESRTADVNVKLTPTQKNHLQAIAKSENKGCSTLIKEAIEFYLEWYPHRDKFQRHHEKIEPIVDALP